MTSSLRDHKLEQFFKAVLKKHKENGEVPWEVLGPVLQSLGRGVTPERVRKIREKFQVERGMEKGIDLSNKEFILTISSLNVVDVKAIDDKVFDIAFKTFDQDEDGLLSLHEARIVLGLFLPIQIQQEQELVETIIYGMDNQKDGYIRQADMLKCIREVTTCSLSMYKEEFMLASLMLAGFLLYQVFKQCGMVPVIGVYEGPIGT